MYMMARKEDTNPSNQNLTSNLNQQASDDEDGGFDENLREPARSLSGNRENVRQRHSGHNAPRAHHDQQNHSNRETISELVQQQIEEEEESTNIP